MSFGESAVALSALLCTGASDEALLTVHTFAYDVLRLVMTGSTEADGGADTGIDRECLGPASGERDARGSSASRPSSQCSGKRLTLQASDLGLGVCLLTK